MARLFFPLDSAKVSWNTTVKQSWDVQEYVSASGERKALVQQELPKITFAIDFPKLTREEVNILMGFYAKCKGSWRPFFYKDYEDYQALSKPLVKAPDGVYRATMEHGGYVEEPEYIDNVVVYADGRKTDKFSLNGNRIVVNATGTEFLFDYEYWYKVCFADSISVKQVFDDMYKVSLTLTVVR